MEAVLGSTVFSVIDPPYLKISLPRWIKLPSANQTYLGSMVVYFLITAGIVYDIINEPPSIGAAVDERGIQRPQVIMPYRLNGQYIMEGLVAAFLFMLTAVGFIILDKANTAQMAKNTRTIMLAAGGAFITIGYLTTRALIKVKMPNYLY